mgnify:FL=1|jgi:hypothetical protein|tara:strand:+ start:825 stop:1496 length:672 start_codon:yes stop_codon:yes gene_type:complete
MTLTELKTIIQNYVENDDTTFVNTLDDIIKNTEERIFELVQFDYFRKNVKGQMTLGSRFLTAPSDFELSFSLATIDSNGEYHFLEKKHTSFMQEYTPDPTDSTKYGLPLYYGDYDKDLATGTKESTLIVAPTPNANYEVELHYLYKPNSLVTDTTGTWLSDHGRNALIYGCLVEAYTFMKGENDLLALYENRFQQEIARLKNKAEARGRRDEYRYDSLRSNVS